MSDTNSTARGLTRYFTAIDDAAFQSTTPSAEQPSLQDRLNAVSEPIHSVRFITQAPDFEKIELPTLNAEEISTLPQYTNSQLILTGVKRTDRGIEVAYSSPTDLQKTEMTSTDGEGGVKWDYVTTPNAVRVSPLTNCLHDDGQPRAPFQADEIKNSGHLQENLESPYADVVETTSLPILSVPEDKVEFFRGVLKKMAESSPVPFPEFYPVSDPSLMPSSGSPVNMEVSFDYTPIIGQADYEAAKLVGQTLEATEAADFRNIWASDYRPSLIVRNPLDKDGNPVGGLVLHPQAQGVSTSILTPEEARLGWSHSVPVQVSIESEENTPRVETPQESGDQSIQRAYSSTTITRGISDLEKTGPEEPALPISDSTEASPFAQRAIKIIEGLESELTTFVGRLKEIVPNSRDALYAVQRDPYLRPATLTQEEMDSIKIPDLTTRWTLLPDGETVVGVKNTQPTQSTEESAMTQQDIQNETPEENQPLHSGNFGYVIDLDPSGSLTATSPSDQLVVKCRNEPTSIIKLDVPENQTQPVEVEKAWSVDWGNKTEVTQGSALEEVFAKTAISANYPKFDPVASAKFLEEISQEGPFITRVEDLHYNPHEKPTVYEIDARDQEEPVVIEVGAVPEIQELTTWAETAPPKGPDWEAYLNATEKTWRVDGIILGQIYTKHSDPAVWDYLRKSIHNTHAPSDMKVGHSPITEEAAEKFLKSYKITAGMDQRKLRQLYRPVTGGYYPNVVYTTPIESVTHVIHNFRREGDFLIGDLVCFSQEWYDHYLEDPIRALCSRSFLTIDADRSRPRSQELLTWDLQSVKEENIKRRKVWVQLGKVIPDSVVADNDSWEALSENDRDWSMQVLEKKQPTLLLQSSAMHLLQRKEPLVGGVSSKVRARVDAAQTQEQKNAEFLLTPFNEAVLYIEKFQLDGDQLWGRVLCDTLEMAEDVYKNGLDTMRFRGLMKYHSETSRPEWQTVIAWDYRPRIG